MRPLEAYTEHGHFPGISTMADAYANLADCAHKRAAEAFGLNATRVLALPEPAFSQVFEDLARSETFAKTARGHAEHAARLVLEEKTTEAWDVHVTAARRLAALAARCSARIKRRFARHK